MAGIRYDFDPCGRAQSYVEDWEREFAASNLRAQAREARRAQQRKAQLETESAGVRVRLARRVHLTRSATPRLRAAE